MGSEGSVSYCVHLCSQSGLPYAGVQYKTQCWCGSEKPNNSLRLDNSNCDMRCEANPDQFCGGFFTVNVYETGLGEWVAPTLKTYAANDIDGVRIVFLFSLNGRAVRQVRRLLSVLYHPSHYYYLHIDARQEYLYRELLHLEDSYSNIRLVRDRLSTIWGGATLLKMMLQAMDTLLNIKEWHWDYIINLSESDFPIKSTDRLSRFLTSNKGMNFLKSHGRDSQKFIQKQGLDRTFVECDKHMWRLTVPSRCLFLFSCLMSLVMVVLRLSFLTQVEDICAVLMMLLNTTYFFFFGRGFKAAGPAVVMIYRMIVGDLLRFVAIYIVFVMGFAQAYFILFLSYSATKKQAHEDDDEVLINPLSDPSKAVMAMFIMSLNRYDEIYSSFEFTRHEYLAKVMFVVYMALVTILLVNMLIAMMGNTYQKIAATRNEWQRQWARIVMVVERGVSPRERRHKLLLYSEPMADGRRALLIRKALTDEEKEELKEIQQMRQRHKRSVLRRRKGSGLLGSSSKTLQEQGTNE